MSEAGDDCSSYEEQGFSEEAIRSDPALIAQGWKRRYLADPPRAEEAKALYRSLGFEVRAQELNPVDFGDACAHCAEAVCGSYVLIYTRKTKVDGADQLTGEGGQGPRSRATGVTRRSDSARTCELWRGHAIWPWHKHTF